jgi:hypothetical protein
MKKSILFILIGISFSLFSQKPLKPKKGQFYIYWGWNKSDYSKSDIHFKGDNYDFTLQNVVANDRQSKFESRIYLNPKNMTIPQYNFRLGYFINDKYNISIGADHMKYVMQNGLNSKISGTISNTNTIYDGTYENEDINLANDFVLFEHTDGLNYENIEIRRFDYLYTSKYINIAVNEGLGLGVLIPKTNCTLINNERYDEFHVAGYGLGAVVSLNFEFFKYFFLQAEYKAGFINMPNIRTTKFESDIASQHFFFSQYNAVFGAIFPLFKAKEKKEISK